jgi:hypothetical protein
MSLFVFITNRLIRIWCHQHFTFCLLKASVSESHMSAAESHNIINSQAGFSAQKAMLSPTTPPSTSIGFFYSFSPASRHSTLFAHKAGAWILPVFGIPARDMAVQLCRLTSFAAWQTSASSCGSISTFTAHTTTSSISRTPMQSNQTPNHAMQLTPSARHAS